MRSYCNRLTINRVKMRNSSSEPVSLKYMSSSFGGSSLGYNLGPAQSSSSVLSGTAGVQNSSLRGSSCSPPRARVPDCGKMKLVAVGNRFCLSKLDPIPAPGSKTDRSIFNTKSENYPSRPTRDKPSPGGQQQTSWPISLRSRSNSDERSVLR